MKLTDDEIATIWFSIHGNSVLNTDENFARAIEAAVAARYEAQIKGLEQFVASRQLIIKSANERVKELEEGLNVCTKLHASASNAYGDAMAQLCEERELTKTLEARIAELESGEGLIYRDGLIAARDTRIADLEAKLLPASDEDKKVYKAISDDYFSGRILQLEQQLAAEQAHRVECVRYIAGLVSGLTEKAKQYFLPIGAAKLCEITPTEALDAALAKAREEALAGQWRPAADAPKDCTYVLVRNGKFADVARRTAGEWFSVDLMFDPTHYAEIPPLPATEQKGGAE